MSAHPYTSIHIHAHPRSLTYFPSEITWTISHDRDVPIDDVTTNTNLKSINLAHSRKEDIPPPDVGGGRGSGEGGVCVNLSGSCDNVWAKGKRGERGEEKEKGKEKEREKGKVKGGEKGEGKFRED